MLGEFCKRTHCPCIETLALFFFISSNYKLCGPISIRYITLCGVHIVMFIFGYAYSPSSSTKRNVSILMFWTYLGTHLW